MSKNIETTVYTIDELREQFPIGYKKAIEYFESLAYSDDYYLIEIVDCMKSFCKSMSYHINDYSVGNQQCSKMLGYFENHYADEIAEFSGKRAIAYFENNFLVDYRIGQEPILISKNASENSSNRFFKNNRYRQLKHIASYLPGNRLHCTAGYVASCPITGLAYDHCFIEYFQQELRRGESLGEIMRGLADYATTLYENELEYHLQEDTILEQIAANEYYFTKQGELE